MKRLRRAVLDYKLFSLAIVTIVCGLGLQLIGQDTAVKWLLGSVSLIVVIPLLKDMWYKLRSGLFGVDVLALTAIVTAVILGEWWAAIVVVLMLTGGEALENFAERRAKTELDALLRHAPRRAHILRKGKIVSVKASDIRIGDKVVVKAGEVVPVDALIIEGMASFDESSLTGESLPQARQAGDQIISGTVNIDGPVTAKAVSTADNSQYQQIIRLVRGASATQAPFVRLADRYALPFTILAYAIASTVWILSGDATRFLEVIIVATPCPLLLAAPIAVISGMARASRYGIIVKSGAALERLARTRSIVFDKTGTLTSGRLTVDKVRAFGDSSEADVLSAAACVEQNSSHVVAHAIVEAARSRKIKYGKARRVREAAGLGLEASIKGQELIVGRLDLLRQNDVKFPAGFKPESIKKTAVYVAIDGKLAGAIMLSDALRPETKATLTRLSQLGLPDTVMVTGDNHAAAQAVARELGISAVHADALPADKLHIVEGLPARPVAFVGDGVNDAPVLAAADVGIALGARGSTAASESADMVIMLDDVSRVASGVEIAKRSFKIARQSILIGIGISVGLMGLFATGKFTALSGALIQEVVDVVVIFNALRAHLITPSEIGEDQGDA